MSNEKFDLLGRIVSMLTTISQMWGILVDLCEKLSSSAGPQWEVELGRFLRKEPTWSRRWTQDADGVIHFTVVSDGTSGPDWIKRFEAKGAGVSDWAKQLLLSSDFVPTKGVKCDVAVLPGKMFSNGDRVTKKIRAEAGHRKLPEPPAELACLIRDAFSNEEVCQMGFYWITVFHKAVKDSGGALSLLNVRCSGSGPWLNASYGRPDDRWRRGGGFAFLEQVSS